MEYLQWRQSTPPGGLIADFVFDIIFDAFGEELCHSMGIKGRLIEVDLAPGGARLTFHLFSDSPGMNEICQKFRVDPVELVMVVSVRGYTLPALAEPAKQIPGGRS